MVPIHVAAQPTGRGHSRHREACTPHLRITPSRAPGADKLIAQLVHPPGCAEREAGGGPGCPRGICGAQAEGLGSASSRGVLTGAGG